MPWQILFAVVPHDEQCGKAEQKVPYNVQEKPVLGHLVERAGRKRRHDEARSKRMTGLKAKRTAMVKGILSSHKGQMAGNGQCFHALSFTSWARDLR